MVNPLDNSLSCSLPSIVSETIRSGYCAYSFEGILSSWISDCFSVTTVGTNSQYSSLLWMEWEETIVLNTAPTTLTREVSTHFRVDITLPTTVTATSANFGFPPSNTLILSAAVTDLDYQVVDSSNANFKVQITVITRKEVVLSSLRYNTVSSSTPLIRTAIDSTDALFNQQIFILTLNDTCQLTGTFPFTANYECFPAADSCNAALALPTSFTLTLTTNNVCPQITISPYTATAYINLYDTDGRVRNTFQAGDTTLIVKAAIVVSPAGGPPISEVTVGQILINSVELDESEYTVDSTQPGSPSISIQMSGVLLLSSPTGSNTLQLVLYVDYSSDSKKRAPRTPISPRAQRSVGTVGFFLVADTTVQATKKTSDGNILFMPSALFVFLLCTLFKLYY